MRCYSVTYMPGPVVTLRASIQNKNEQTIQAFMCEDGSNNSVTKNSQRNVTL